MAVVGERKKRLWKKSFRRRKKDALSLGQQADEQIEEFLIRRFERLVSVKRFVFLWTILALALLVATILQYRNLSSYYQVLRPAPGGIYSEGLVGDFSNANPLYSAGAANASVSKLVFSGLFKYNKDNKLVGDLATSWDLDKNQTRYIVHLRHNVLWHDGAPFTADDVIFTYQTIQNPEAQSSLYSSWQGIKVTKKDAYTVNFDLPDPLSSFPYSMVNGIVPAHLLKKVPAVQMRSAEFNTDPVGTGPFEWKFVEVTGADSSKKQQRISLAAYDHYWAGRPKLDGFNITTFTNDKQLIAAFNKKQLNAISGLDSVPGDLASNKNIHIYRTTLTSAVMAFFNNSNPILSDVNVRRALVAGVDRNKIPSLLDYGVDLVNGPLLPGQLGYNPAIGEPAYNQDQANKSLDKSGWTKGKDGIRTKDGKPLRLTLSAQDTQDYTQIAQFLQRQWGSLGVKVEVHYYSVDDLQNVIIADHDYDILLYGISIGVDPDVFAYWDSSQASVSSQGHLNLSEYKSTAADQALEGARTRADSKTRAIKYKAFLSTWAQDVPALALYQPNYLYVSRGKVFNYGRPEFNSGADRYANVNQWMIRQKRVSM